MSFENTLSSQNHGITSKILASILVAFALVLVPLTSWSQDQSDAVKMSKSGICHEKSSKHYERVKKFTPYKSIQECLDAGGRKPKS